MPKRKEYDFVVTLKHANYTVYNVITVLMCVVTLVAFVFAMLNVPFATFNWVNMFLAAFIILSLVITFINNKPGNIPTFRWTLFAAAFLWLLYPLHIPVIGILFIVAALLERQIKFPQEIGFSKEAVTFNTFPFKNYVWQQFKNVMLKDNLLTLDFSNNKILQKETETDVSPETEKEFNEFCKLQLADKNKLH